VFTDNLTWRWCFWINLPFGALSIAGIFFFLRNPERPENRRPFKDRLKDIDYLGPALFIPAITCFLLALQYGGTTDPWTSAKILTLLGVFLALMPIWVYSQFSLGDRATIPPRILLQRSVFFGSLFTFFLGSSQVIIMFYIPLYFQAVRDSSATKSGVELLPYLISSTLSAIFGGVGMSLIGYVTPFMIVGGAIHTVGCGLLTMLSVDTPSVNWILWQVVAGIGVGMNFNVLSSTLLTDDSPR